MDQRLAVIATLALLLHTSVALADTNAHQVSAAGLERTYYLHVPPGAPADRSLSLVLVFHGGSGSPANIERETRFSELADREGFLVAYPQGYQKSFNDGRGASDIPAQRDRIDDVAFVTALIDDVGKKCRVDPKGIYATGISNGGMVSHFLGAKLSTKLAAIAPVAGSLAEPLVPAFAPTAPVSVLMLVGTDDRFVPYGGGEVHPPGMRPRGRVIGIEQAARLWTERNGGDPTHEPRVESLPDRDPADGCRVNKLTYAAGRNRSEVVLYRLEGAGHTWPDGSQYLSKQLVGPVCRDINATEVIWQFFKLHPKQ